MSSRIKYSLCSFALALLVSGGLAYGQVSSSQYEVDVKILVLPTASIHVNGSNVLHLSVPPPSSTNHSSGMTFVVTGNASATMLAEPSSFMTAPTIDYPAEHLGEATLNGDTIGYRVKMDFPVVAVAGSPIRSAQLPGWEPGPTDPPLTVNLMQTGGTRSGRLHIETSQLWTPSGAIALPGVYQGEIVLTVSAD